MYVCFPHCQHSCWPWCSSMIFLDSLYASHICCFHIIDYRFDINTTVYPLPALSTSILLPALTTFLSVTSQSFLWAVIRLRKWSMYSTAKYCSYIVVAFLFTLDSESWQWRHEASACQGSCQKEPHLPKDPLSWSIYCRRWLLLIGNLWRFVSRVHMSSWMTLLMLHHEGRSSISSIKLNSGTLHDGDAANVSMFFQPQQSKKNTVSVPGPIRSLQWPTQPLFVDAGLITLLRIVALKMILKFEFRKLGRALLVRAEIFGPN
jgi:hypothetical protein